MSKQTPSQGSLFDCRSLNAAFGIDGDDFIEIGEDHTEYRGWADRTGMTHTQETKDAISFMTKGCKNPRYGVVLTSEQREKSRRITPVDGANNPNAKSFLLLSPEYKVYKVVGNLREFCSQQGISFATMHAAVLYGRRGPRSNGWSIQPELK